MRRALWKTLEAPFTRMALVLIAAYQRILSPLKGYSCAYRIHRGGASCSAFGAKAIERHGVTLGVALLRRRFSRCSEAYSQHARAMSLRSAQAGFCDAGCDFPCECGNQDYCEYLDLCDCCSWGDRKKNRHR